MSGMRRLVGLFGCVTLLAGVQSVSTAARAADAFPDCAAATATPVLVVGSVACQRVASVSLGGDDPVSYYIPPECDPALGRRCPVLYLLHGFGGDYHSMLSSNAGWVQALSSAPPDVA